MQVTDFNEIKTQGIKYAGSKLKLIPYILEMASDLNLDTILDGFSGTTRVSQAFAKAGCQVTCSDVSKWSEVFGKCYLQTKKSRAEYFEIIQKLNSLEGKKGWFTENYSVEYGKMNKAPFQLDNLMKLDAIREYIEDNVKDQQDKMVLLSSLILALDKVDSTIGHFSSYLADWSPRSFNKLKLDVPKYEIYEREHEVLAGDVFENIKGKHFDLAYYDPPYGSNNEKMPTTRVRYASYYHFWSSVILFDRPNLFGRVNRREDTRDKYCGSVFEDFRKNDDGKYLATEAIRRLIKETDANYIIFSYSNGGRSTKNELIEIFNSSCKIEKVMEIDYKSNVMSTMKWTNAWIDENMQKDKKSIEYLFLLRK